MRYAGSILVALLLTAAIGSAGATSASAPAPCSIVEGLSIGGVRIGMPVTAALAVAGVSRGRQPPGTQTISTVRPPWLQIVVEDGVVRRVATQAAECRTTAGIGVGTPVTPVRQAYAASPLSTVTSVPDGEMLSYPFAGIAFLIRDQRVGGVEVFRPEATPAGRPDLTGSPATPRVPRASSPGPDPGWTVRSLSARVEETTFVVTGTIENRGRAMSVYADVAAFGLPGAQVVTGQGPVGPDPVPSNGSARFEARLPIDDVVRRYAVAVRPVGSITVVLAERSVTVGDLQQFHGLIMRRLTVASAYRNLPRRVTVTVTNPTSVTVSPVGLAVSVSATCLRIIGGRVFTWPLEWTAPAAIGAVSSRGSEETSLLLPVTIGAAFSRGSEGTSLLLPSDRCDDLLGVSTRARILRVWLRE